MICVRESGGGRVGLGGEATLKLLNAWEPHDYPNNKKLRDKLKLKKTFVHILSFGDPPPAVLVWIFSYLIFYGRFGIYEA